jgi:hypothetical protein
MVFVLFLTSLAVIEYLLHRDRADKKQAPENQAVIPQQARLSQTDPGSLLSLADAIERQGRGSGIRTRDEGTAADPQPAHKVTETPR